MMGEMNRILTRIGAGLRVFARDRRANVAMMFGIALVPIVIAAGIGLDYSRAALKRSQMSDALDAAALAVGSTPGLSSTDAQNAVNRYFQANYKGDTSTGIPSVSVDSYSTVQGTLTLTVNSSVTTVVMKAVGIDDIPVSTSTTVVWGQSKLWVALVLDNSTSMNEGSGKNTKMKALQDASKSLLLKLQSAASTDGDVKVGIVPFTSIVNVDKGNVNKSWLYWGEWEAPPANAGINNVTDLTGPGDACPFSTSGYGYGCLSTSANSKTTTSKIPSSGSYKGYICPGFDSGSKNPSHVSRYYNGCFTSDATGATKQVASGRNSQCPSQYGNCTCTGDPNSSSRHCDANYYKHVWKPNDHSTWTGCVIDREKDYDIANTAPNGANTTGFPASNPENCFNAKITALGDSWDDLADQITAMKPDGSTNQPIGIAHGWQMLTPGDPWGTPPVPDDTSRYIILFSDGLNTLDRWYMTSTSKMNAGNPDIDARMVKASASQPDGVCDKAKAGGIIIYSVYIHLAGDPPDSAPLQNCATDSSKYFNLSSTDQIATAFDTIAQQITNVRVSR